MLLLFFSTVRTVYRGGGWDGYRVGSGVGGLGDGKIPFGIATMPIGAHTMAHATSVGDIDIQSVVGTTLGPHHLISALHWCHCSSHDFGGLEKCPPEKQTS